MKLLVALCLLITTVAVGSQELKLGAGPRTFSINWLPGFTYQPKGESQRYVGPNSELVIATVGGWPGWPPSEPEIPARIAKHVQFAERELPRLASAKGDVVKILTREELKEGSFVFSTATQSRRTFRDYFYLQFFLVSRYAEVALITIEGFGAAADQYARFRPLFESATWQLTQADSSGPASAVEASFAKLAAERLQQLLPPNVTAQVAGRLSLQLTGPNGESLGQPNLDRVWAFCSRSRDRCEEAFGMCQ